MALTDLSNANSPSYTTFLVAFAGVLAFITILYGVLQHCLWIDRRHYQTTRARPAEERREQTSSVRFVQYKEDSEEVELDIILAPLAPAIIHHTCSSSLAHYPPPAPPPCAPLPPLLNQHSPTLPLLTQEQEDEFLRIHNEVLQPPSPAYSSPSVNSRGY